MRLFLNLHFILLLAVTTPLGGSLTSEKAFALADEEMLTVRFVYNRRYVRVLRNADSQMADSGQRIGPGAVLEMTIPRSWIESGTDLSDFDMLDLVEHITPRRPAGGTLDNYYNVRVISPGQGGTQVPSGQEYSMALSSLAWGGASGNLDRRGSVIAQNISPANSPVGVADLESVPVPQPRPDNLVSVPIPTPRPDFNAGSDNGGSEVAEAESAPDPSLEEVEEAAFGQGAAVAEEDPQPAPMELPASVHPGLEPVINSPDPANEAVEQGGVPTETADPRVTAPASTYPTDNDTQEVRPPSGPNDEVVGSGPQRPPANLFEEGMPQDGECREILRDQPPFMVSDETDMGYRNWENFRDLSNYRTVASYIPLRSIVRVLPEAQQYMDQIGRQDYIPVEVLSTPNAQMAEEAPSGRYHFRNTMVNPDRPRAARGDQGYIYAGSLRRPSGAADARNDFTFVVAQNAPLLNIPGMDGDLRGRPLRLATRDGKFRMNECCQTDAQTGVLVCEENPIFEILGPNLTDVEGEVTLDEDYLCHVRAVSNRQVEPLLEIAEMAGEEDFGGFEALQFIDSRGLVKMPLDRATCVDGVGVESVFGSFHYRPDGGCNQIYDAFAAPESACAFMRVLEAHQRDHANQMDQSGRLGNGYEIQWGDMYHEASWGVHQSHGAGECIDIRPLRPDGDDGRGGGVSVNYSGAVDMDKTCELIQRLQDAGASTLIFGQACDNGGVTSVDRSVHHNHIHVCFPASSPEVRNACQNGL